MRAGDAAEARFEVLAPKKLVGLKAAMSLAHNTTAELWRRFMPRRHEITNRATNDYVSLQVYGTTGPEMFAPGTQFEKWALVEVADHDAIPEGMERYDLHGGLYAVFVHEGPASAAPATFGYIFGTWLPQSGYELDDRPHFEVLPEGYDPMDPNAREEVWIPLKR